MTKLLLVWKHPETRLRYLVGTLERRDDGAFVFRYTLEGTRAFFQAKAAGFDLLPFKDPHFQYESTELFKVFSTRLPRPELYAKLGISPDDAMGYLAVTGGRLATDTLEFLEPVQEKGPKDYTVRFPVAGWRYHEGEKAIEAGGLEAGCQLSLCLQPDNRWDPSAILITFRSWVLGYVPAVYAHYIDLSVKEGSCEARVDSVGSPSDPQVRVMVKCSFATDGIDDTVLMPVDLQKHVECLVC